MTLSPAVRVLLWPLSLLYGEITRIRAWLYAKGLLKQRRLNRPVISIGNLTVGGTGKTPMAIWFAERLSEGGKRVGILSRGYKGAAGTSDEIELMKLRLQERAVFGVGANRYQQGRELEPNIDVFLLDDGFQHLQLARDVNILLIDSAQPLAKQILLPTGRLREPVSAMARADILVFTRTETVAGTGAAIAKLHNYPVFSAATRLLGFRRLGAGIQISRSDEIGAGPFYAFCGIGNPRAFFQDLRNWKFEIAAYCEFPDHHRYDARDARELEHAAQNAGARALFTTEKDAQNLSGVNFSAIPVFIAVTDLEISKEDSFLALVNEKLAARMSVV
jgi:tetraacyldisaccharide 4'-kinase